MATTSSETHTVVLKSCETENCQRISATLCHHCNKNVCRRHFNEHADQLLQELNSLGDSLNDLTEKISSYGVKEYKQETMEELIEWRDQSIQKINVFFEWKRQKLDLLLQENENRFLQRTADHSEVLDGLINETKTLVQEGDVTFEQLQILKQKLSALQNTVNETHTKLVYCDMKPLKVDYELVLLHSSENSYMYGGTLLCADYQMKLNDFYGDSETKWQLIYKATQDGFFATDFHRCCDNKGPTMTIVQSKNGNYLFGGYTGIDWTSDNKYKQDPTAFLFTLTNPHDVEPTKFSKKPQAINAVGHSATIGPYFGGVVEKEEHFVDISIASNAVQENSTCSFPSSYEDTTGIGETLFTGTNNFKVQDIEVYMCLSFTHEDEDD